jgi:phospholipase/lecithinase/hemolysin
MCRLAITAAMAGGTSSVWATSPYSAMYAFGDSFSDTGNLVGALATRPVEDVLAWWPPFAIPGYADGFFQGRPTNGLSAVEHLAGTLGIGLTNYAWTGALSGHGNVLPFVNTAFGATGLRDQVDTHLALTGSADPDALYFVWGGHNDFWGLGQALPASLGDETRRAALQQAGLTSLQTWMRWSRPAPATSSCSTASRSNTSLSGRAPLPPIPTCAPCCARASTP